MSSRKSYLLPLSGVIAFGALPTAAHAQAVADPNSGAAVPVAAGMPTAQGTADQNTIVITAQRRLENDLAVPVTVSVMKRESLHDYQAAGADTLLSLSGRVPSLYVESSTGRIFPRFYIRGLGNIDFYLGASQPVEIVQDDVILEHVILKSNPAFDIAQVEVLKGPQGSLFGRNTTAGIVKFDSAQPTSTWQGQASVSVGSRGSVNADAGIGGPLDRSGVLSFRLSGLLQHRDKWIRNAYIGPSDDGTFGGNRKLMGGFDERDARLQLLFKPSDRLSLRASGHVRDYSGNASIFYRGSIIKGTNKVPANFDRSVVSYDEARNNPQAYKTHGASLKADYDLGGATLTAITAWEHSSGYSRGDTDGGAAANFGGVAPNYCAVGCGESQGRLRHLDQWSEEVRLASPDAGAFRWQVGGIYFDSRDLTEFDQRAFFLNSKVLGTTPNPNNWVLLHNVNTSWGIFGQASFQFTDALTLTGGVRLSRDSKHTVLLKTANTVANVSTFTGARDVKLADTKPSFDASLLYRMNPHVSVYARAARGFRGPTIQGRSAVFNSPFTTADSETNTSFEAGIKTTSLDNRIHLNVAGFSYVVDNIQLNGNDSNGNGVLFNADKGRGFGMEAELTAQPTRYLRFGAGLSLLHTRIKDKNVYAQVGAAGGVPSETVLNPLVKVGNNYFAQIDGNSFANAPTYNLNLNARYDIPVSDDAHRIFIAGDFNMQGKTSYVPYRSVEYTSKGNFEIGAKVGYAFDRYEVAAFARNITNEKNLIGAIDTSNYRAGIYNEPRMIGLMLSGSFR